MMTTAAPDEFRKKSPRISRRIGSAMDAISTALLREGSADKNAGASSRRFLPLS